MKFTKFETMFKESMDSFSVQGAVVPLTPINVPIVEDTEKKELKDSIIMDLLNVDLKTVVVGELVFERQEDVGKFHKVKCDINKKKKVIIDIEFDKEGDEMSIIIKTRKHSELIRDFELPISQRDLIHLNYTASYEEDVFPKDNDGFMKLLKERITVAKEEIVTELKLIQEDIATVKYCDGVLGNIVTK